MIDGGEGPNHKEHTRSAIKALQPRLQTSKWLKLLSLTSKKSAFELKYSHPPSISTLHLPNVIYISFHFLSVFCFYVARSYCQHKWKSEK